MSMKTVSLLSGFLLTLFISVNGIPDVKPYLPLFRRFGSRFNYLIHAPKCGGSSFMSLAQKTLPCSRRDNEYIENYISRHQEWLKVHVEENRTCSRMIVESERSAPPGFCDSDISDHIAFLMVIRDPFDRYHSYYRMITGYIFNRTTDASGKTQVIIPPGCDFQTLTGNILDWLDIQEQRQSRTDINKLNATHYEAACPSKHLWSYMKYNLERPHFHRLLGLNPPPYSKFASHQAKKCINRFVLIADVKFDYEHTLNLTNHFLGTSDTKYPDGRVTGLEQSAKNLYPTTFKRFYKRNMADYDFVNFARSRFYSVEAKVAFERYINQLQRI